MLSRVFSGNMLLQTLACISCRAEAGYNGCLLLRRVANIAVGGGPCGRPGIQAVSSRMRGQAQGPAPTGQRDCALSTRLLGAFTCLNTPFTRLNRAFVRPRGAFTRLKSASIRLDRAFACSQGAFTRLNTLFTCLNGAFGCS